MKCRIKTCNNEANEGHKTCERCRERERKYVAERRSFYVSQGLCSGCGRQPVPGQTLCEDCRTSNLRRNKISNKQRREKGLCYDCENKAVDGYTRCQEHIDKKLKWNNEHQAYNDAYAKQKRQEFKQEVMFAYGSQCVCCQEKELAFLCIDHINGGGKEHLREIGEGKASRGSGRFYKWLRDNGYPPGFQILCFNCNNAKHMHGICPHQIKK